MAGLVDTNIVVYRFDRRSPDKQRASTELLRAGVAEDTLVLAHQTIIELVAAVSCPIAGGAPLLSRQDALREAEELLGQFRVLYPTDAVIRTALRGAAAYQLSWFDVHMWAYAECSGLSELYSEDFEHDRVYGSVRVINPFLD